jgi:hypothetical protein
MKDHPDRMHAPYFGRAVVERADSGSVAFQFHQMLDIYRKRLGVDDNFTVRVLDKRTAETLEVYTLDEERIAYDEGVRYNWMRIDRKRAAATKRLVRKWAARGVPRKAIMVKWGRAHQVAEAFERDKPFAAYERRLARHLGLSILPAEIGTVETFNQDYLISTVGARSRYQMMPTLLERFDIHRYSLRAANGAYVQVKEEQHPLLTMEPAFMILRGYINAVGHEIPGISAYHTGPANIYHVYELFFKESGRFTPESTVMDAYMWAVTEGFAAVRKESSFGPYSRGYVASAYGALKAVEDRPVDTSQTMRAVRVRLKPGRALYLSDALGALQEAEDVDWGPVVREPSLYARFRALNPHIDLPAPGDGGALPRGGDLRLTATSHGHPVRFFLPLGAPRVLARAGFDGLDNEKSFRFDETTFSRPESTVTEWDRAYARLTREIEEFGFTPQHRKRLLTIYEQFKTLAVENPTPYRERQLRIAEMHRLAWLSGPWRELSEATILATGRLRMEPEAPVELPVRGLPSMARSSR